MVSKGTGVTSERQETVFPDMSFNARARRSSKWRVRSATSRWRVLPDFVTIGAQRAGTTSLHDALSSHPQIIPSFRKEVHYFDVHHMRGIDWYRANFPLRGEIAKGKITGEATPNYLAHPLVAERMAESVPGVRLIALLRDPVERTVSSWRLTTMQGYEERPFEQAISDELSRDPDEPRDFDEPDVSMRFAYLEKSRYAEHLERWFRFYPRERILVLRSESMFDDPQTTMKQVLDFLEVETDPEIEVPWVNASTRIQESGEIDRSWLIDYFRPYNKQLEELLGIDFGWD